MDWLCVPCTTNFLIEEPTRWTVRYGCMYQMKSMEQVLKKLSGLFMARPSGDLDKNSFTQTLIM